LFHNAVVLLNLDADLFVTRRTLPQDWKERVANVNDAAASAPLTERLKEVVALRFDEALLIEDVQHLALFACGDSIAPSPLRVPASFLEDVGEAFVRIATDDDPLNARQHPVQFASNLSNAYGELLVLCGLKKIGFNPIRRPRTRASADWFVRRGTTEIPVEMKSKQITAAAPGRLSLAIRGIALLAEAAFVNDYNWSTNASDEFDERSALRISRLLFARMTEIGEHAAREGSFALTPIDKRLDFYRRGRGAFGLRIDETLHVWAEPNSGHGASFGTGSARCTGDPFAEALEDLLLTFHSMLEKQAARRPKETLFIIRWELPFHWFCCSDRLSELTPRWQALCDSLGIGRAALLPVREEGFPPILTRGAAELDLAGLHA
jgi:hypothetical protein